MDKALNVNGDKSRFQCEWAQQFYQKPRDLGHRHHTALWALAHKWLKILLAMKQSGQPYDDIEL